MEHDTPIRSWSELAERVTCPQCKGRDHCHTKSGGHTRRHGAWRDAYSAHLERCLGDATLEIVFEQMGVRAWGDRG